VHMATPKIQSCSMVVVKVNGIQKIAMVRSATARLTRKTLRSVCERSPTESTMRTTTLPVTARTVVVVYRAINTYWYSSGKPGSCHWAAVVDSFDAGDESPASAVVSPAITVHAMITAGTRSLCPTAPLNLQWSLSAILTCTTRLSVVSHLQTSSGQRSYCCRQRS